MACTARKAPFLKFVASRGYAAQALPKSSAKADVQSCVLPNKLVVAAVESPLPVSRIAILFRAGSRNETYENLGAAHMIGLTDGLATKRCTNFAVTRNIQQIGGSLTVSVDREVIAYTVQTTNDHLETGLKFLQNVATGPAFKPWEVSDSIPRLMVQLAAASDQVRAIELLHKSAFRTGLGNSILCPDHQVGKLSCEALEHYVNSNFTTNRCAVVGVGVDLRLLSGYAQDFELETGSDKTTVSKYFGGEIRCDKSGNVAHVAVAGVGGSLQDKKEVAIFSVLQQAAGIGACTKRGNINGALGKVVSGAIGNAPFAFSAINAAYTDSGLFGFIVSADGREVGKAVQAAAKALQSGSISAADVTRGKALLKTSVLCKNGTASGQITEIGKEAVLLGNWQSTDEIIATIDSVSHADVCAAAKKVSSSKLSMGAVGNLASVPFVSDLS